MHKGLSKVRSLLHHWSPEPAVMAPLTLAPQKGSLSLGPMYCPQVDRQEELLQLPFTPETFEAVKELIEETGLPSTPRRDRDQELALRKAAVPSRSKLAIMARSCSTGQHTSLISEE